MQCPFCGNNNDKVVDSRSSEGGRTVRRRRECQDCRRRFTTYERPDDAPRISVTKKDGKTRQPYDRQKIIAGLEKACYKRPVSDDQIRHIVDATEDLIFHRYDKEVPSRSIGDIVGEHLRRVDKVAYIRFASVYRQFQDVGELIDEAEEIRDEPEELPGQRELFAEGEGEGKSSKDRK